MSLMSKSKAENDECKIFTMSTALTHARARSVNALEVSGVFHRFHAARTNRRITSEYRENEVKARPLAILCCHSPRSLRSTACVVLKMAAVLQCILFWLSGSNLCMNYIFSTSVNEKLYENYA